MNQQTPKITAPTANALNQASFLMSGITWQESLLQAYRNYMVVTQSIFLAVSFALFNSQITAPTIAEKSIFIAPFLVISILGLLTLRFLSGAINERSKSVDWWQRRLLKHETSYSKDRHFSTFRVAKENEFNALSAEAHSLNQTQIDTLLRAETPKARRVFGMFVPGFYVLWAVVILSAGYNFPWGEVLLLLKG